MERRSARPFARGARQCHCPDAVAISEAVEIVTDLSTDQSPNFVNGLLGRIEDLKPILTQ